MAAKRHDDGRVCLCDRPDGTCAGSAVRRLSQDRVQELAEEIWAASLGDLLPARTLPDAPDPRSSRAGASAEAAYRRRRAEEHQAWRLDWAWWSLAVLGAAAAGALLVGVTLGDWLGWPADLLAAVWTGWRLRFRPSPRVGIWRRQAAMERHTARVLAPLEDEGWLVLHDLTLPRWLHSLEHLVVGPTGVWVVASWQPQGRLSGAAAVPTGLLGELRSQTYAIAELLDGWAQVPIRSLLCLHRSWPGTPQTLRGIRVTTARQLAQVVRSGSPVAPGEVERATGRLLEVLRPAA
jgi:hypothetical protein